MDWRMEGTDMAEVYQISNKRFVTVRPIKGSPCYLVRECYQEPESPTGWYETHGDTFIPAASPQTAAQGYIDILTSQRTD